MGTLTLLTLPIGNREDLTLRAKRALEEGTFFAVEDTRSFKSFLNLWGISLSGKKIYSYHDHSKEREESVLLAVLEEGHTLYLASDAGSPLLSDPAFPLVQLALEKGHQLETLPGVSAVITGLELSGLPPYPFHFYGFFPREKERALELLAKLSQQEGTFIFFEAPSRVLSTLERICETLPRATLAVTRELTKKFEAVTRFSASELAQVMKEEKIVVKGEFTLVVHLGKGEGETQILNQKAIRDLAKEILENGARKKDVAKLLAEILGLSVKETYTKLANNSKG